MQGRASQIDCAVTERYRAVTFRPEFAVLVEFCAADKFHYTRAADTVSTVKILSLWKKPFKGELEPLHTLLPELEPLKCFFQSDKNFTVLTVSAALV